MGKKISDVPRLLEDRLMTPAERSDFMHGLGSIGRDIHNINRIAEERDTRPWSEEQGRGPLECNVTIDSSKLGETLDPLLDTQRDIQQRMIEGNAIAIQSAENLEFVMEDLGEGLGEIHATLEDIHHIQRLNLGALAIGIGLQLGTLARMGDIEEAVRDLEDAVVEVRDEVVQVRLAIESATELIISTIEQQGLATRNTLLRLQGTIDQRLGELAQTIEHGFHQMLIAFEKREQELLAAIQAPLANEAEEKYKDAVIQNEVGELSAALTDLEGLFQRSSTHPRGWLLFAHICFKRGQITRARDAYWLASRYAKHDMKQDWEVYEQAMVALMKIEQITGNQRAFQTLAQEAEPVVGEHPMAALVELLFEKHLKKILEDISQKDKEEAEQLALDITSTEWDWRSASAKKKEGATEKLKTHPLALKIARDPWFPKMASAWVKACGINPSLAVEARRGRFFALSLIATYRNPEIYLEEIEKKSWEMKAPNWNPAKAEIQNLRRQGIHMMKFTWDTQKIRTRETGADHTSHWSQLYLYASVIILALLNKMETLSRSPEAESAKTKLKFFRTCEKANKWTGIIWRNSLTNQQLCAIENAIEQDIYESLLR